MRANKVQFDLIAFLKGRIAGERLREAEWRLQPEFSGSPQYYYDGLAAATVVVVE